MTASSMEQVTESELLIGGYEWRGVAQLSASGRLEGGGQGRGLWRILASRGIVEARNAQTLLFSLFYAFFCDCRPSRRRQRWSNSDSNSSVCSSRTAARPAS